MRFATYRPVGKDASWGCEVDGDLFDLGPSGLGLADSLLRAMQDGSLPTAFSDGMAEHRSSVDDVEFLPPIEDSRKIICVGVNYRSHQEETGKVAPAAPTIFTRFADSQMGHGAPALYPASSSQFDYEGEMALVIGKPAWHVPESEAFDYVAGYAVYNDFSVRDWQRAASQWIPGKNFPGTGAFGPYFVPAADIADVNALTLETRVNGEVRQFAGLSDLVFTIPQLIAYITGFTSLEAGDVIVTGTPGGVGLFMEPQGLLSVGDLVEVTIPGLGQLSNRVVQA